MKLVFASDSFKGTLTSKQISTLLDKAAHEVFGNVETVKLIVADGGEGTMDALIDSLGGVKESLTIHGPLMEEVSAYYGKINERRAIIEMAVSSGLTLVPESRRNPLYTSSYGLGELVKAALINGADDITVCIGGSATNDGGMGFLTALGVRFLDADGNCLEGIGANLSKVVKIDMSGLMQEADRAHFTVMCDVTNPLCGENGATYTYGRQKGASDKELEILERGMVNYRDVIIDTFGINPDTISGSGAAGGVGAALKIFLNADIRSGIETVLDMIGFDSYICDADYVITGEGRADAQSVFGKVVKGVGDRSAKYGIPAIALCGSLGDGYEKLYEHGIKEIISASDGKDIEDVMKSPDRYYYEAALELFDALMKRTVGK